MGLLNLFSKSEEMLHLMRLPSGTFTVDAEGNVIASTLPRNFPENFVREMSLEILKIFRGAKAAQLPLTELAIQFAAMKVTAREQRGGAIIFLAPENSK